LYLSRKDNDLPIVIDSGASFSVSPTISDFVGAIRPCRTTHLNGLKGKINVVGEGDVEWTVQDIFGTTRKLRSTAYYIPNASVRLFSPQTYFQKLSAGSFKMDHKGTNLTLKDGTTLAFPYNAVSTLPLMLTTQYFKRSANFVGLSYADTQQLANTNQMHTFMSVANETNQNLNISQKELLFWHQRLGHADQQQIRQMLAKPVNSDLPQVIQTKTPRASAVLHVLCATCQLAKQPRTGAGMSRSIPVPGKRGGLATDKLQPGQTVSIDQYMSSSHGRLAHTKGKESKSKKFTGGTLFADHATLYIHCTNQVSLRVGETLKGKNAFEKYVKHSGVDITGYHADSAPFRAAEFVRDCDIKNQTIDYSGVGAHHQNGLAEGSIKTVCSWARAMMLHFIIHWPGEARLNLWPMALDHSVYLWNNMPKRGTRMAPIELFTGMKFPNYNHLQRSHVWGCPVYVLNPMLQDGKKIPKWKPRARRGFYIGVSKQHSTTVGRVLNLNTGFISNQYHCVYDVLFSSAPCPIGNPFDPETFCQLGQDY
jgi:hypothetical protein